MSDHPLPRRNELVPIVTKFQRWRERAEEMRALAENMRDDEVRAVLGRLADDYDRAWIPSFPSPSRAPGVSPRLGSRVTARPSGRSWEVVLSPLSISLPMRQPIAQMIHLRAFIVLVALAILAAANVAMGQPATSSPHYPGPGHAFQFDFGRFAFKNEYNADSKQMTFTRLSDGRTGTVNYTAIEVRPNLFFVYWMETDGTSVARVEDHESRTAHAVVHFPDGRIVNLSGTFRRLD